MPRNYFTSFKASIDSHALPERFTFPFYYQPHPLCLLAAKELQEHLETQTIWQHNFGISGNKETAIGKMFGVLLVQNKAHEIGYLAAFSGKLAGTNHLPNFVPPVFDMLAEDDFFTVEQLEINKINEHIQSLENNPQIIELESIVQAETDASISACATYRKHIVASRKIRKSQRAMAEITLDADQLILFKEQLANDSVKQKLQLRDLNLEWSRRIQKAEENLNQLTAEIAILKSRRKHLSATLQKRLFDQYQFLNNQGISRSLCDIFKDTAQIIPPAGAGECAAPKLLHYAFKNQLKPLAMAEFWWGASPKSEIRKHQNFYPSCQGKCQPILKHMLAGIKMDKNPLLANPATGKTLDIIYQDEVMLVINKPAEFLSVPGKNIQDSVYLRMQQSYPRATGPLIVHRLDMSTSGLMLIALSKEVHKILQRQFIKRTVKKRYVALLDDLITGDKGIIDLPLRVDLDDRPRQLVCYEHGRSAQTQWQVIDRKNNQTRVYFYPITGRTHQLRVHSAHIKGLNTPIVGDDLYGSKANRLHLHAEYLEFHHPVTNKLMHFQLEAEF
ncbi:RluA family pseudouridine synthase [Methyloprofundus sedimenti]|uniref:RluA family pseudouridine synthase n=1 Tax=Methyloprofundus sedimenti TaxID=1420851 RepID=UPI0018E97453|nr:RluA family pseudouridine synthase [Methyloprofundus sedimenti]